MLDARHPFFPFFLNLMREAASRPPVYDLGTSARFAKEIGLARHLFDARQYAAGGYRPDMSLGADACDFHCDLQNMPEIADGSAGSILCISVLEHVADPHRAVREMHRILQPGGVVIASVPFFTAYHGKRGTAANPLVSVGSGPNRDHSHGGYGDYWRFTHEGLGLMFGEAGFSRVDVYPIDGRFISRLHLLGLYFLFARLPLAPGLLARLDRPMLGRVTSMHYVRAEK
jgi:SAM-dependent methyltransferase